MATSMAALMVCCLTSPIFALQYTWNGGNTDFNTGANWDSSVNPLGPKAPQQTIIGSTGYTMTSKLESSDQAYNVGRALVLRGQTTLILGNGLSQLTIQFAPDATGENATFTAPGARNYLQEGNFFDYNCELNWKVGNDIPMELPFVNDTVMINPGADTLYVSTNGQLAGAKQITDGQNSPYSSCSDVSDGIFPLGVPGGGSYLSTQDCSQFYFSAPVGAFSGQTPTSTCSDFFPVSVQLFSNVVTYRLYYKGARTGQLYEESESTLFKINPGTSTYKIQQGPGNTVLYKIQGDTVIVQNEIAILKTAAPTSAPSSSPSASPSAAPSSTATPKPEGSTGGDGGGGGGMGIIAGAAAGAVLLIGVILFLVMRKKGDSSGGSAPARSEGVGFENPLYDVNAGSSGAAATTGGSEGLYADTVNFEEPNYTQTYATTGGGGGYADLPVGGLGNPADGYLDVEADLDGFGDSDSE